ncbi:hypothetical protein Ping_1595 [Psychromonas ingrahamii 37]|uniref:Uncharacterized protein n=1 Tax=Psychromonas ingrahamii (strain DSM 17664 / CCUG 51855 / 37) TaxID=357804 RepID=A1SV78_PSYIN|nr:hypothetical protein [Psychromonas ingrahamii]ABM03393.1 hypothetical protein Ping_1595 [Psychromonas ingrahamii 37]
MSIIKEEINSCSHNLIGYKTERLTVLEYAGCEVVTNKKTGKKSRRHQWKCVCTCGHTTIKSTSSLVYHKVKSCGCQKSEVTAARNKTHGMVGTPEYQSWRGMKERCSNPKGIHWNIYGGKGIKICDRWVGDFLAFYEDMGQRPEGMSLDRIDSNGNYCPENCRWADANTQAFNTCRTIQITFEGETLSLYRMAEKYGQGEATVRYRLNQGWSIKEALLLPVGDQRIYNKHSKRLEYDGQFLTVKEHAERYGLNIVTVRTRIGRGYSLERVFAPAMKRKKKTLS